MMQETDLAGASLFSYKIPTYSLIPTIGIQVDSRVARGSLSLKEMIALKYFLSDFMLLFHRCITVSNLVEGYLGFIASCIVVGLRESRISGLLEYTCLRTRNLIRY